KGFVFSPFDQNSEIPVFIRADKIYYNQKFCFVPDKICLLEETEKTEYLETAEKFINAINSGFRKLVLSRIKALKTKKNDVFEIFEILQRKYKNAFVYLLNHPQCGCWAGASPELFLAK
ncbi:chorismate-binding protein, partial [Arthrospira platensis SPKY1]|nr:chorismate-binding protein [Arthrospira platensis SPKY1]